MGAYLSATLDPTVDYHKDVVVASEFAATCEGTDKMLQEHVANMQTLAGLGVSAYTPPFCMRITSDPSLMVAVIARRYGASAVTVSTKIHYEEHIMMDTDNLVTYHRWIYVTPAATHKERV